MYLEGLRSPGKETMLLKLLSNTVSRIPTQVLKQANYAIPLIYVHIRLRVPSRRFSFTTTSAPKMPKLLIKRPQT